MKAAWLPRRERRRLFAIVTVTFPLVTLVALELLLRSIGVGPDLALFRTVSVGGRTYRIMNPAAKNRYFTRVGFSPNTSTDHFLVPKPPGTFRVFCLGASTTAGFPYGYAGSFTAFLRDRLRIQRPGQPVEVINLGMTATSSYATLDIGREVLEHDPDALCVYDGHNEFYGALGTASHEPGAQWRWLTQLSLKLVHLRLFLVLREAWRVVTDLFTSTPAQELGGTMMERLARGQYTRYESEQYRQTLENFRANLRALRALCTSRRVPLFLASQVSNLRDLRPFVSQDAPDWTPAQRLAFNTAYNGGLVHSLNGHHDSALVEYARALAMDSLRADVHFDIARTLDSLQRKGEAEHHYILARDLDMLRFRASSDFNTALKEMDDGENTHFVDVERTFRANSPDSLIGGNLILEHLHPNARGNFLIAGEFARFMQSRGIPAGGKAWSRLDSTEEARLWNQRPVTRLDELCAERRTETLTSGWPFQHHRQHSADLPWEDSLRTLAAGIVRGEITWEEGHVAATAWYERQGDLENVERELRVLMNQLPLNVSATLMLGRLAMNQGRIEEATRILRRSIEVEATAFAAKALGTMERDPAAAIPLFDQALTLSTSSSDSVECGFLLAQAYERAGKASLAVPLLEQVLVKDPTYSPARALLQRITRHRK